MFKKKNDKIHDALSIKVQDYLFGDEELRCNARVGTFSYFITDERMLVLSATNHKLKGVNCQSYYFNEMLDVQYLDMSKKLSLDTLIIRIQGNSMGSKLTLTLPHDVAKETYQRIMQAKRGVSHER